MAAAKHTPGPWLVEEGGWKGDRRFYIGATERSGHIASVNPYVGEEEEVANASLIAAAPDLYRQLSGILALADVLIQCSGVDPNLTKFRVVAGGEDFATITMTEMLDRARVALAKADGGAA